MVIERYREQMALAQGYFGDSIINSVTDTLAAAAGFAAASPRSRPPSPSPSPSSSSPAT
ncbi:MAG: DUF2585 family protein [Geminicoccaceae bacterium]